MLAMTEHRRLAQPLYLAKLLLGLGLLGAVTLIALEPSLGASLGLPPALTLIVSLLAMLLLAPAVLLVYRRMDELNQGLHQQASTISLTLLAAGSGVLGVLQARGLLPLFNQFWLLGGLLAVWGIALMLRDRRYR